jgi:hypothetical protein
MDDELPIECVADLLYIRMTKTAPNSFENIEPV